MSDDMSWWLRVRARLRKWRSALPRRVGAAWRVLAAAVPGLVRDALIFGGVGLLSYGAWLAWDPAGPIVAGASLLYLGVFGVPER